MSKIKIKYTCALVVANDLIGGKWKLRILWHIAHGDNRFSLLTKAIPDISQKVLTVQLKELEESGIITKTVVNNNPPKTSRLMCRIRQKSLKNLFTLDDKVRRFFFYDYYTYQKVRY